MSEGVKLSLKDIERAFALQGAYPPYWIRPTCRLPSGSGQDSRALPSPNSLGALEAIQREVVPHWHISSIPDIFYTGRLRDLTLQHLEQISAHLKQDK
jgi:hypothetical protein